MDKIVSERTIKRRAATQAAKIVENFEQPSSSKIARNELKEAAEQNLEVQDSNSFNCEYMHQDEFEYNELGGSFFNDIFENQDIYSSSSDESSDSDNEDIAEQLREWIVKSGTPLCHATTLLALLKPHFPSLPKDARTLLKTPRTCTVDDVAGGKYHHFSVSDGLRKKLKTDSYLCSLDTLTIQINVDGLPLFKSSTECFWPILALIKEESNPEPFIIGLWVGKSKPSDCNDYLRNFVEEVKILQAHGLSYESKDYKIQVCNFVCDAPARSFIKCTKNHTGYYGCDFCEQKGLRVNFRMTFPDQNSKERSDIAFDEMQYLDDHQHRGSKLAELDIGLVSMFPHDYMHLVCLGVMRKMLGLLMAGPLHIRLGGQRTKLISERIKNLASFLPREFLRKGRSLAEIDRWKATEFRTFLLYTGPIAMRGIISDILYKNFLLLSVGIRILCCQTLCSRNCDYAGKVLKSFVQHFGELYGEQELVYNVHGLTHLASQCKLHGPLHGFSAFPFENYLQTIKKLIRKPKFPLEQVVHRLEEKHIVQKKPQGTKCFKKKHNYGPLQSHFGNCEQFQEMHSDKYFLSTKSPDSAIFAGNQVYLIKNIVNSGGITRLICVTFRKAEPYFHYPLESSDLDILQISSMKDELIEVNASDVSSKAVLFPGDKRNSYIAIPLIQ